VRSLRLVHPQRSLSDFNEIWYIEVDEWWTTICRMTRSKVKIKVTSSWKPLKRRRPLVPHQGNFLQAGCSLWRPTNSVKALKAILSGSISVNMYVEGTCVREQLAKWFFCCELFGGSTVDAAGAWCSVHGGRSFELHSVLCHCYLASSKYISPAENLLCWVCRVHFGGLHRYINSGWNTYWSVVRCWSWIQAYRWRSRSRWSDIWHSRQCLFTFLHWM